MTSIDQSCRVKVCGVTTLADARQALEAGAFAIGVNLIPVSPRYVEPAQAREIVASVKGRMMTVAVVADRSFEELQELRRTLEVDRLQLHGSESPELVRELGDVAYKAARISNAEDVALAESFSGELLLVDAKVPGVLGGSGVSFDWELVSALSRRRRLILAGGLRPGNVGAAVRRVRPWAVDVASGLEIAGDPRRKDPALVSAFIAEVAAATRSASF